MDIVKEDSKQGFGYHYTSLDTLLKISDSIHDRKFTMHASGISFLNDSLELEYGYPKIMEYLPNIEKFLGINDSNYKLSKLWEKDKSFSYDEWCEIHIKEMKESCFFPCVISLSRNRDSLPLWVMYGKQGTGAALVLDTRIYMIDKGIKDGIHHIDLNHTDFSELHSIDVVYDAVSNDCNAIWIAKYEYSQYWESVQHLTDKEAIAKKQLETLTRMMILAAPFVKHGAYQHEKESRIISIPSIHDIKFKEGLNNIQHPYIELDLPITYLKEIVVGPCADYESVRQSLTIKMLQKGIENVKISKSDIPYRN